MLSWRLFLLTCLIGGMSFISTQINGQKLSGIIKDAAGLPIKGASIYLSESGSKKIAAFSLSNEKGEFQLIATFTEIDSLVFSHIGYKKEKLSVADFEKTGNTLTLYKIEVVLTEVVVKSPIVVNGDTTKFNASYFSEQTDHKLKDLVEHLPGFEITPEGKLKYKNKIIEKITIEGEDLFANKSTLLLNSIPIHAIDEVQVLENQLENKKLKGFESGDRVYLNLSLKKNRVKFGFGDVEIGANTKGRGLANFTNFTLAPKMKLAFIGGFESLGQSTFGLEDELTNAPYKEHDAWMLNEPSIETYFRVPDVYYKYNNLVNTRVKINAPVSKKLTSETELHFLSDRQSQNNVYNELILDTSGFVAQTRYTNYTRKPLQILANEKLHWDISESRDLKITLNWIGDFLEAFQQRRLERITVSDTTVNHLENNKNFGSVIIDYLHKISDRKANIVKFLAYSGDFKQDISGLSQNYFSSFDLPFAGYEEFRYPLDVKKTGALFQYTRMTKAKNISLSYGLIAKYDHVIAKNDGELKNLQTSETFAINSTINASSIDAFNGKIFVTFPLSIFDIPTNVSINGGAQYYGNASISGKSLFKPIYDVSLLHEKRNFLKYYSLRLRFYNQLPSLQNFNSFYRPVEFNGFRAATLPLFVVDYQNLDFSFRIGKSQYVPFTSFSVSRESAGFASRQILKPNIQFINDTLIEKPLYNANVQFNWNIIPRRTKFKINAYYFFYFDQGRLLFKDQYYLRENFSMRWNIRLSRDWKKKLYSSLETGGDYFIPQSRNPGLFPMESILNWNLAWKNKYQFGKNTSLGLDATYFKTNATSGNAIDFTALDFLGDYSIPKSSFNVSFIVQNILNEKALSFGDQSPTYQSIYKIPLLGINFLLKLRYEL